MRPWPLHRLVDIHRVQAGRVEAGQPHVAHDHDAERVFRSLKRVRQFAALVLVADVRLPVGAVLGAAGHDDLRDALPFSARRRRSSRWPIRGAA